MVKIGDWVEIVDSDMQQNLVVYLTYKHRSGRSPTEQDRFEKAREYLKRYLPDDILAEFNAAGMEPL